MRIMFEARQRGSLYRAMSYNTFISLLETDTLQTKRGRMNKADLLYFSRRTDYNHVVGMDVFYRFKNNLFI